MSTTNLSPNTRVPKSGLYYCTMCKEGDSVIRDVMAKHAREKGVDPRMLEGIFGAAGIGSNEPTTRKSFKAGDTFGECSRHGKATGWTLEKEDVTQDAPPVPEKPSTETVLMECPPFSGNAACSDNDCPCPNTTMPPAKGYLWIKQEIVDTRMKCLSLQALQGFMSASGISSIDEVRRRCLPIVVCEQSAKRRGLDLAVAASDYESWVKTGKVPCRATPLVSTTERASAPISCTPPTPIRVLAPGDNALPSPGESAIPEKKPGLFSFSGRARRTTFWAIIPLLFVINFGLMFLDIASEGVTSFVHIPLMIPIVWLAFATYVKRWHDMDKSGWMILTLFIPPANLVILLLLGVLPGTSGPNKYGEDPRAATAV